MSGQAKANLGIAGTRAGAVVMRSLRAPGAPLLIDSYALQEQVLRCPFIAQTLNGLAPLGLVGLGVSANGVRRPRTRSLADRRSASRRSQVGDDGEHAAVVVRGFVDVELLEDVLDVAFDGLRAEIEAVGRWPCWSGLRRSGRAPRARGRSARPADWRVSGAAAVRRSWGRSRIRRRGGARARR